MTLSTSGCQPEVVLRHMAHWFGGRTVRVRFGLAVAAALVGVDVLGAGLLFVLLLAAPLPAQIAGRHALVLTVASEATYAMAGTGLAYVLAVRYLAPVRAWREGAAADRCLAERRILDAPAALAMRTGVLWGVGVAIAGLMNISRGGTTACGLALVFLLAALVASALTYLVADRLLRPLAAEALSNKSGTDPRRLGMMHRILWVWWLTTGVGVAGIGVTAALALAAPGSTTLRGTAVSVLMLTALVAFVGFVSMVLVARASSDPVTDLRTALAAIARGEYATRVLVWDGTELGQLQVGFNQMAEGLEERERMRDLFGKHVGIDVAASALGHEADFEGETRAVCVLFIDIVGSTAMAQDHTPTEVIAALNEFFAVVIDTVHEHGGWINKFVGDAALALWGAPSDVPDAASRCLAAARELAYRISREVPLLRAGIGVSQGEAVAGNVGGQHRYEYTAIGDPINEASRLMDLAKTVPGGVVANARLVDMASAQERQRWVEIDPVVVRGRASPTRLATPSPIPAKA